MSTTMVGQRRKILELHWIKRPKTVLQKTKFGPENKWFKTSENKWLKTSYLDFINFRFSGRKSQSQQKLAKKITHFEIQFRSKNLTHFRDLNSFNIINKILQHSQTPYFIYFPANMFLVGVRKTSFALHLF